MSVIVICAVLLVPAFAADIFGGEYSLQTYQQELNFPASTSSDFAYIMIYNLSNFRSIRAKAGTDYGLIVYWYDSNDTLLYSERITLRSSFNDIPIYSGSDHCKIQRIQQGGTTIITFFGLTFASSLPSLLIFQQFLVGSGVSSDIASWGTVILCCILILSLVIFMFKIMFGRKR